MIRRIIKIDNEKCNGCGLCVEACHEGAIGMQDGKAKLLREDYCDGLGDCLPVCPTGAISSEAQEVMPLGEAVAARLHQWPLQIKLVSVNAPYFDGARLLIAADCAAFTHKNFHEDFIKGKVTLIGCPKLDEVDYSEKLTEILKHNDIKSVTVVRMEVPCCGGIEHAVMRAVKNSGKRMKCRIVTLAVDGSVPFEVLKHA